VGAGVSTTAFPTFTDGSSGVAPVAADMQRIVGDLKALNVRPAGRWLRIDVSLQSDNNWYNCRVGTSQYDVDAQGGHMQSALFASPGLWVDTFDINTTGLYLLSVRERFAGFVNGNHGLRIQIVGSSVLTETLVPVVAEHPQTNHCWTEHALTAGQQIQFQHSYNGFGDARDLTLYTDTPTPEIIIRQVQERILH
jgi:hypothetical protein